MGADKRHHFDGSIRIERLCIKKHFITSVLCNAIRSNPSVAGVDGIEQAHFRASDSTYSLNMSRLSIEPSSNSSIGVMLWINE